MNKTGTGWIFLMGVLFAFTCAFSQEWEVKSSGINPTETLVDISAPSADGNVVYACGVTTATVREDHPRFSPDGGKIAYHSNDINNAHNLFVINADGTGKTKLTSYTGNQRCDSPVWSADGVFIYFSYSDGSQYDICRIGANGTDLQNLT